MTFYCWIIRQTKRDDPVGDLARDVKCDEDWPRGNWPRAVFISYLESLGDTQMAVASCKRAWAEYCRSEHERWLELRDKEPAPLEYDGPVDDRGCPVVRAYSEGQSWKFWCRFCKTWHSHGAMPGHRIAHCSDERSPFRNTGYILECAGALTPEIRRRRGAVR